MNSYRQSTGLYCAVVIMPVLGGVREWVFIDKVPGSDGDQMNLQNGIPIHCHTIDSLYKMVR